MGKQANCPSAEEWISECGLTYDGALFDNKKESSVDTCYNMNEPWKHCGQWKSQNATYCMIPFMRNVQNLQKQKHKLVVAWQWGRGWKAEMQNGG